MRMIKSFIPAAAALTLGSEMLLAHPGHEAVSPGLSGLLHPLTGLDHLLAMVMVGMLAVRQGGGANLLRLPSAFAASMLTGAAAAWGGWHIPGAEWLVATSVIVIGLAVAMTQTINTRWALMVVMTAGAMHGHVHALESSVSAAYVGGMLMSTILLHAAGVAGGLVLARRLDALALRTAAAGMVLLFTAALILGV